MKRPFTSPDEVQQIIRERHKDLIEPFFACKLSSTEIMANCADGSTFRAYHTRTYRPSTIFRTWAIRWLQNPDHRVLLSGLRNVPHFLALHQMISASCSEFWENPDDTNNASEDALPPYKVWKLIDLILKFVPLWDELSDEARMSLVPYLNVPLDRYTLNATRDNYVPIQTCIRTAVGEFPPIYFDLVSWDREHSEYRTNFFDLVRRHALVAAKDGLKVKPRSGLTSRCRRAGTSQS